MENKQAGSAPVSRGVGGMGNEVPQVPSWFIFVRYAQIVLTLIVFVCSCVALSQVRGYYLGWGAGFSLFTSIYTAIFLAGVMLVPKFAPQFYFKWFCLGAEAFCVLWWLCSFAGLASWAAWLSLWTSGFSDGRTVYGACAAGAAFGAFNWIAFCVTLVFYSLGCHRHRVQKSTWNGGVEAGAASMGPIGVQHTGASQPAAYDPNAQQTPYYQGEQQYPTVPTPAPSQGYHS
ncbi:hypothetical protein H072_10352 [Dactylellina haptotyla CBS 200.50]|uniref:MARVEL domain-containing protein n=1 Tax=Dactylellina haptotyla (strain CBS 200.50) TaxID=1284197 RepID=S8BLV7_DACHA|nr:hypothetical protein H072_10352 [Dactylellina haptotyla CBS 200.50]